MKLNLITVCTDTYPIEYATKITRRFKQLSDLDVTSYCITDRPLQLTRETEPIEPFVKAEGWWNKMLMYSPEMPKGWNLYLDLDMILLKNFDAEILHSIENGYRVSCVKDPIAWHNNLYNSSFVIFKTGQLTEIYDKWLPDRKRLREFEGGDQVWTGQLFKELGIQPYYMDNKYPSLKKSLKYGVAENVTEKGMQVPTQQPKRLKILDCNGRPKPHEMGSISWIKKNWHDI